ncbi:MAG: hypothetical protein J6J53_06995 [Muribaculaceae bacterium]|nr:hypothetical protein [Muribaculaceae bacterium]
MTVYADLCIWAATAFATMAAGKAIAAILGFASFALYIASVFTGHAVDAAKRSGSIAFGGILLISALASLLLPQPIHIIILSAGIFILSLYYYFNNSTATK